MTGVSIEEGPRVRPSSGTAFYRRSHARWRRGHRPPSPLEPSGALGRMGAAMIVALAAFGTIALAAPLGKLHDPLALVLVLPPLGVALDAFGWSEAAAGRLRRLRGPVGRTLAGYGLWLVTSAFLTLDVAAVVAASVGMAVGRRGISERSVQLESAIIGSNGGSLLFPFSNLTNLVVLAGAGVSFGAYVGAAFIPQVAAAGALGLLLAWRARAALRGDPEPAREERRPSEDLPRLTGAARVAGAVALLGAIVAVVAGCMGLDVAPVFATATAFVCALAVHTGRVQMRQLARSVPASGVLVIVGAAILGGPMTEAATHLDFLTEGTEPISLLELTAVGAALAAITNNLPAAAFGAVLLVGAPAEGVVAYLIGTNIAALATPHGSLATILCRAVAGRAGHKNDAVAYLRTGWRFAAVGSVAALLALAAFK